ncbi:MAG TPA: hydrogenase small subunit [Candidatus Limnocylindrales bacterium]|nr:hydrogenase small subunit [Candidatus Limnocylindrales bacterium]
MDRLDEGLLAELLARGVSRRSFLKLCVTMTGVLALPAAYAPRVAAAVAAAPRMPVIWLRGQGCGGDTEALLRGANPTTAELLLDLLSVDYHDAFMVSSGTAAATSRVETQARFPNGYFAVVEGAIPTAEDGAYLTIGGRPFGDIVREVCDGAVATIAVGSCAFDGGLAAANGGATGAVGVGRVVSDARLVTLPGCPINVENLTATILHYLTFQALPATDGRGRPLFAYGALIHNQCGRRSHFEFGEFVQAWGDEGAQKGWCLYKMGCKGPETFANCPSVRYGSGTSWPVKAGAACIGCTTSGFWDAMSPFSRRLPSPIPFAPDVSVDQVGQALVGGVGVLVAAHGTASIARSRLGRKHGVFGAAGEAESFATVEAAPAAQVATEPEPSMLLAAEPIDASVAEPAPPVEPPAPEPAEPVDAGPVEPAVTDVTDVTEAAEAADATDAPGATVDPSPTVDAAGAALDDASAVDPTRTDGQ